MIQFDERIFQMGWHHQLVWNCILYIDIEYIRTYIYKTQIIFYRLWQFKGTPPMPPTSRKYCLIKALKNHHCDHSMIPFPGAWHRADTLKILMHRVKPIGQSASDCLKSQSNTRMWQRSFSWHQNCPERTVARPCHPPACRARESGLLRCTGGVDWPFSAVGGYLASHGFQGSPKKPMKRQEKWNRCSKWSETQTLCRQKES